MINCLAVQISREVVLLAEEPPLWKSGTTYLEKWRSLRKKVSLTPKKVEMRSPKKSLSPIPSENVLFAKNRIKIGKIWPLQLHFWSTDAYRGSPPYAIFPIPDTKKYSIVLCYPRLPVAPGKSTTTWRRTLTAVSRLVLWKTSLASKIRFEALWQSKAVRRCINWCLVAFARLVGAFFGLMLIWWLELIYIMILLWVWWCVTIFSYWWTF